MQGFSTQNLWFITNSSIPKLSKDTKVFYKLVLLPVINNILLNNILRYENDLLNHFLDCNVYPMLAKFLIGWKCNLAYVSYEQFTCEFKI